MDRRGFLLISLVGALAAPLAAEAQQAGDRYRIGFLATFRDPARLIPRHVARSKPGKPACSLPTASGRLPIHGGMGDDQSVP
jgi:hypothetical protein